MLFSRVPQDGTTGVVLDGVEETADGAIDRMHTQLCMFPKSLHDLWHEYQFGLNEGKQAREFKLQQRGENKSLYCRIEVFWNTILLLVRAAFTTR